MSKTDNYHTTPKMREKIIRLHNTEGLKAGVLSIRFGVSVSGINKILADHKKNNGHG